MDFTNQTPKPQNRLRYAASLYLRKHADNPIDWWPWCDEALALAQQTDKPIFLSVGYSSCHWCTVMEGEAFSDPAVAAYLNEEFIAIKVDREERPDLDSLYMQILQMLVGQGGWPMNLFLSPHDRIPFYGGTYFPLEPRYGRPGFLQVLQSLIQHYRTNGDRLLQIRQDILSGLRQSLDLGTPSPWSDDLLPQGLDTAVKIVAPRFGGNSFPMMPYALTALHRSRWRSEAGEAAQKACYQRALDLALGGIYDQVAGGFHRYTVDATWTVPHFEKMLYDNGQILEFLALVWRQGLRDPALAQAVEGTVAWLQREMRSSDGYFYAAQDADSFLEPQAPEPEEGAFYVWDYATLEDLLSEAELIALTQEFTVTRTGNFEGKNVLQRRQAGSLSASSQAALTKLFRQRYGPHVTRDFNPVAPPFPPATTNQEARHGSWPGRIPPVTDTKLIVAWNALMISGLAVAALTFNNPQYYGLARSSAQFILDNQWQEVFSDQASPPHGRFHRLNYDGQVAVLAQAEDYVLWIKALLDLRDAHLGLGFGTEGEPDWLTAAIVAQQELDHWLWCDQGGYYSAPHTPNDPPLMQERSYLDNATPSPNGIAVTNLVRLSLLTDNLTYLDRATQTLQAFQDTMAKQPQACPSLFMGLDWWHHQALLKALPSIYPIIQEQYWPTLVVKAITSGSIPGVGLVCQGLSCQEPVPSAEDLVAQLQRLTAPDGV